MEDVEICETNDIYCHCTECSNPIEILSLKNYIIRFKCANEKEKHEKEISFKNGRKKYNI